MLHESSPTQLFDVPLDPLLHRDTVFRGVGSLSIFEIEFKNILKLFYFFQGPRTKSIFCHNEVPKLFDIIPKS